MASLVEELGKAYVDGMPLNSIEDRIKDIVTYYKDNSFTVDIYLDNDYTHINISVNLNIPSFTIYSSFIEYSSFIDKTIDEIANYFKILGFKEI